MLAAAERRVEVDEVDPLGARLLPGERGVERVAVRRLGAGLALDQAHGLPVRDVDGGQQRRARSQRPRTQFASSAAPASPDFSGWNCVADSGPFSTAASERARRARPRSAGGAGDRRRRRRAAPSGARRRSARSRTARARRREQRGARRGTSTVFHPMCGSTGARRAARRRPATRRSPRSARRARRPVSKSTCMPTQMPSTGRPPASRRPISAGPATDAQARHARGERADARHDQPVGRHRGVRGRA